MTFNVLEQVERLQQGEGSFVVLVCLVSVLSHGTDVTVLLSHLQHTFPFGEFAAAFSAPDRSRALTWGSGGGLYLSSPWSFSALHTTNVHACGGCRLDSPRGITHAASHHSKRLPPPSETTRQMLMAPRGQQIRSQHSHIWLHDHRAPSQYRADLYDRKPPKWTWLKPWWQLRVSASFYVVCEATKWHAAIMTIVSLKLRVRKQRAIYGYIFSEKCAVLRSVSEKQLVVLPGVFSKCLTTHTAPYFPLRCKSYPQRACLCLFAARRRISLFRLYHMFVFFYFFYLFFWPNHLKPLDLILFC